MEGSSQPAPLCRSGDRMGRHAAADCGSFVHSSLCGREMMPSTPIGTVGALPSCTHVRSISFLFLVNSSPLPETFLLQ